MSNDIRDNNTDDKKNSLQNLRQLWAKNDIERSAERSRKKLERLIDEEHFEEDLKHRAKLREKEREELRNSRSQRSKSSKRSSSGSGEATPVSIYEAKASAGKKKEKRRRRESFVSRTVRLVKGLSKAHKELAARTYVTEEQEKEVYAKVFRDAWGPLLMAFDNLKETLWDFICKVSRDTWDIVIFFANLIRRIGYYLSVIFDWVSDKIWDIIFIMDQHKRRLFMTFSSVVSATAVVLIIISSVSAYEYSYYGKKLGTAKSKQEVYRTIEVLGDKLSEVTGANINLDVRRDIQFSRVFGFKLDVDSSDEILNVLNYMKDLQATGYAIKINGETAVILESEDVAKAVIAAFRDDYAGDRAGVEYISITFLETVTIDEAQVLLGDIWNADDALRYLETGSAVPLEEGQEAHALIHIHSVETATYEEDVPFENEYIENSSIYEDERTLVSAGVNGKELVVAEIVRENGVEQDRTIISSTRMSNPINAVYYQGTKPIPQTIGTGTFIFPLDSTTQWFQSAYFGERYGIAGVAEVHGGNDYACPEGSHVYASDGGVVTFAGYTSGYGYMVQIDHGGLYETIYAHCNELFVHTGDSVYQGQHIANSGNTGISTGAHLHFEVRYKGYPIDPDSVLYW
ncbi:MAG: peptidoglycan DD-metalloendopeptidase family protein [Firmicutes bacterium]|nr:peptidoglycan DD-metalloendopeptidase family protein [Bacillota bacterium]